MKKKLVLLLAGALFLTGCATKPIQLTDEEAQIISEYAANTVLKYNSLYSNGIKRISPDLELEEGDSSKEEALSEETSDEKISDEDMKNLEESVNEKASEDITAEDSSEKTEEQEIIAEDSSEKTEKQEITAQDSEETQVLQVESIENAAQALGLSDIMITYDGYEIMDGYVEENQYFAVNALPGNELIIMNLTMKNTSDREQSCDIPAAGAKFHMILNGTSEISPQVTLLQADFSRWKKSLGAGEEQKVVLVAEVSEERASSVTSVDLKITRKEKTFQVSK